MDLDADGNNDLITGCFEGGLYLIKGLGDATFAAPEKILDCDGNILRLGQYWDDDESKWTGVEESQFKEYLGICGHAVDFDDDGDFDLLLGSNEGFFFLRENTGSPTDPKFAAESTQLVGFTAENEDGEPLTTGGHAMPIAFDWDQDGNFDIISGTSEGAVMWSRNIGSKGDPKFAPMETLIEAGRKSAGGTAAGERSQVAAGDYDNDGHLDILVGDFNMLTVEKEKSDEEQQRLEEVSAELGKLGGQSIRLTEEKEELATLDTDDAKQKLKEVNAQLAELEERRDELIDEYRELSPKTKMHGFVWLFQGKASKP